MGRQYLRSYQLSTFGDTGEGLTVSDLRISFEINKDLLGFPNLAKISIYNLNSDSRGRVKDEFTKVILNAGYEGDVKQIFVGDIRFVSHDRKGPDFITTIFAADGNRDFESAKTNLTLNDGATIRDVVNQIAGTFENTTIGELAGLDSSQDKLRGVVLTGSSKDLLNKYAEEYNFDWSVQDGVLETINRDEAFEEVTVINSQTGMLNTPTITELGANVRILLNPSVLPNRQIQIESATPQYQLGNLYFREVRRTLGEGFYKVQKVTHIGDNYANDWYSDIVGRRL